MSDIKQVYDNIIERMADAAKRSGRPADTVRLLAVSKKQSTQAIQALAALGQLDFGESTIQEAQHKIPQYPNLTWHCIGHLQSNKTKYVPGLFDWVHSVDSEKLVDRIAHAARAQDKPVNILLQVNTAGDPAKYGMSPDRLFQAAETLLEKAYSHVILKGLMTIGLRSTGVDNTRSTFAALRRLSEKAGEEFGKEYFSELSMGMSHDFEIAIEEGATMVRIGTALFGERTSG